MNGVRAKSQKLKNLNCSCPENLGNSNRVFRSDQFGDHLISTLRPDLTVNEFDVTVVVDITDILFLSALWRTVQYDRSHYSYEKKMRKFLFPPTQPTCFP